MSRTAPAGVSCVLPSGRDGGASRGDGPSADLAAGPARALGPAPGLPVDRSNGQGCSFRVEGGGVTRLELTEGFEVAVTVKQIVNVDNYSLHEVA